MTISSLTLKRSSSLLWQVLLRSLVVGVVYAIANALVSASLGPLSRLAPSFDNVTVWTLTGTLVALAFSPFLLHSTWSRRDTMLAAWAAMGFVRSLGLGIEGSLFKPTAAIGAIAGAIAGILVSLLVAWLAVIFLMPDGPEDQLEVQPRTLNWWGWTWRVLVVGLAYFVFYFVFGATNALLYTKSFYENNPQYGLSLPDPKIIFLAQLIRGPLFGLGSLFIARSVLVSRKQLALWLGILLFMIGGVGPYVEVTFRTMPLGFNLATLTEIFFQNFLTGAVAAALYGSKSNAQGSSTAG